MKASVAPLSGLPMPTRREMVSGSLLLAITGASIGLRPKRMFAALTQDELAAAIPLQLGDYRFVSSSGLVVPPQDELSERLYDQVLPRIYAAPGKLPILALFAYGSVQNLSLELHRPEECYPQQGFTISAPSAEVLQFAGHRIEATALSARRANGYVEQVLFWSRIGTRFANSRTEQSLMVARENFAGRMPDGLLTRLSVPTADRDLALDTLRTFIDLLGRNLSPVGRRIMLGEGGADMARK